MLLTVTVLCLVQYCSGATQLFHNPDFEGASFNGNWVCNGCTLTRSNDHYHGRQSAKITSRSHNWAGIGQTVAVTPGQHYALKGFIKLLNMSPGHMYHDVKLTARYSLNGHNHYIVVSLSPMLQKNFGWTEIGGDFKVPNGIHSLYLYLEIHEADVNYLLDNMSLYPIPVNNNWKTEANQRIKSSRMSALTVNVNNPAKLNTNNMQIEIKQLKHDFAFGTAVSAEAVVNPLYKKYQDYFYDNFEWAVIENALKWRLMEHTRGHINYDRPITAINEMRKRGITVRGHNMFWDFDKNSPSWLHGLSHDQLLAAMHTRVNGTLAHTKGKLVHWDVNNENLHGDYFEQKLKMPNITSSMFRWIHQIQPGVKLFLNEYSVVTSNTMTTAYKMQAKRLKASGVPVYGVGVQSHFKTSNIDYTAVKYRLDKVAEAGLPIWITELTILEPDANKKADALENILTLYFSHPAVEGVLLWGFWDGKTFDKRTSIATGTNVVSNAAGLRYIKLFKQTWTTHVTQHLQHGVHISGYHGNYMLNVKSNGHVIENKNFTLGPNGNSVTITLNGSGGLHTSSTSVFG